MRVPTHVEIDHDHGLAVLQYGDSASRHSVPVAHALVLDIGEDGELLDIEFLSISEGTIELAEKQAKGYGCSIPQSFRDQLLNHKMAAA